MFTGVDPSATGVRDNCKVLYILIEKLGPKLVNWLHL